jgi:hypothetical protein
MRGHLKHLAMCSPMLIVAVILVIGGVGVAALLPVVGCMLMMWVMMRVMPHSHGDRHAHDPRPSDR